ncbi:hypothetical protein Tco_1351461 [Tanacetum coccineum]
MRKSKRNKKRALKNFQLCYSDVGPSLSIGKPLTQEEAAREALAIDIGKRFSILKEERPVIETMAYSDKYKKILDVIVIDKLKLDGEIKKEEEEAIKQTFHAAKASLNTEESDSDNEEDNAIQRNSFGGAPIYGTKASLYLNCKDLVRPSSENSGMVRCRADGLWACEFRLTVPMELGTLDANILRELIGSNERLIPEEIAPSILRLATLRAPRPTNSDLYEKISHLETQIGKIERMTRRQSYHSERYARVLKHIALHFGLTLCDPYDPPSYFKQQQQQDDEE